MFNELIDASNTSLKEGLFTALPAVIIKVHSGNELRYDIQPTISPRRTRMEKISLTQLSTMYLRLSLRVLQGV